ncbi:MAG TPA: glycosyl hydrolase, partial [Planctomycetota bacterium]|nr:glycosyl hydrolase [Planctomycetota bacterium]
MKIDETLAPDSLAPKIRRLWRLSAPKILAIERTCEPSRGAPVFTVDGVYTSRGWTEWTQGFQYGSALLQFEATRDPEFLAIGRDNTLRKVLPHATHMGVHDHGFN